MHGEQNWITVSFAFQKDMRILASCVTCCQAQRKKPFWAHGCHVLKVYCALQACPFFSSLGCICCACSGKQIRQREWLSVFSARGSNVGEVSLKVSRSHALSMLSPSLEISRKKIQQRAMGCFWFCRIRGQCVMTLFWAEKELMRCEIPGTALCRASVGEEIWNVEYPVTLYRHAVHMVIFFKTGLRNESFKEKFDSRVVGECLFSLCSFPPPLPRTVLLFHPFLQKILL